MKSKIGNKCLFCLEIMALISLNSTVFYAYNLQIIFNLNFNDLHKIWHI